MYNKVDKAYETANIANKLQGKQLCKINVYIL